MSKMATTQDGEAVRIDRLERDVNGVVQAVSQLTSAHASLHAEVRQTSTTVTSLAHSIEAIAQESRKANRTNWANVIAAGMFILMALGMLAALVEMRVQPMASREDSLWEAYGRLSEKAQTKEAASKEAELEAARRDLAIERALKGK
jgi:hypothetical protein